MVAIPPASPDPKSPTVLRLMLVDADPVFRLGLKTGLAEFPHLFIAAEATQISDVFRQLTQFQIQPPAPPEVREPLTIAVPDALPPLDLLILDVNMGNTNTDAGLTLCQQLKAQYPSLPLLILTSDCAATTLTTAQQVGVEGYWLKGTNVSQLVPVLTQLATGTHLWDPQIPPPSLTQPPPQEPIQQPAFPQIRQRLRTFSMAQLSRRQTQLDNRRDEAQLSWYERQVVIGITRELKVAQWCLEQWLPETTNRTTNPGPVVSPENTADPQTNLPQTSATLSPPLESALAPTSPSPKLESRTSDHLFQTGKRLLLDAIFAKLPTQYHNQTHIPLEIDILNPQKKQELLILILRRFEDLLDELRFSQVSQAEVTDRRSQLLNDLWEATLTDFFGKYMTLSLTPVSAEQPVDLVTALLEEQALVQSEILAHIPQFTDLLCHLLWQVPLVVENMACAMGSPAAVRQAEALLENLTIQIANAVIQPLLNRFASTEVVKQRFYDRRLLSTRDIERFRNALSWKYRLRRWVKDPQAMFESQYLLIVFGENGFKQTSIYAARDAELQNLSGWPLLVTLALETRDAIAPPLRATFTVVGRGVVYILTQFVGRGLGLVGRGIVQGIGSTWHDLNTRQPADRKE